MGPAVGGSKFYIGFYMKNFKYLLVKKHKA